jgi:hypothetical protein
MKIAGPQARALSMDPRIRIHTNMPRIRNTAKKCVPVLLRTGRQIDLIVSLRDLIALLSIPQLVEERSRP